MRERDIQTVARIPLSWGSQTAGVGVPTTSHLNLRRTLADAWAPVRLRVSDGRWLHRDRGILTLIRSDAWVGDREAARRLALKRAEGLRVE